MFFGLHQKHGHHGPSAHMKGGCTGRPVCRMCFSMVSDEADSEGKSLAILPRHPQTYNSDVSRRNTWTSLLESHSGRRHNEPL